MPKHPPTSNPTVTTELGEISELVERTFIRNAYHEYDRYHGYIVTATANLAAAILQDHVGLRSEESIHKHALHIAAMATFLMLTATVNTDRRD